MALLCVYTDGLRLRYGSGVPQHQEMLETRTSLSPRLRDAEPCLPRCAVIALTPPPSQCLGVKSRLYSLQL